MSNFFLNCQIAAFPAAFLALLVAGAKLYRVTRQRSAAAFSAGMACLFLSQVVLFASYRLWPAVYEHATGIVPSIPRDFAFLLSIGLNVFGLAAAGAGLLRFAWSGILAQPTVPPDVPAAASRRQGRW